MRIFEEFVDTEIGFCLQKLSILKRSVA
jgi:hypothetical protein